MDAPYALWVTPETLVENERWAVQVEDCDDDSIRVACIIATSSLFNLTSGRFTGIGESVKVRPKPGHVDAHNCSMRYQLRRGDSRCMCWPNRRVPLGYYPVATIEAVTVDGATVPEAEYQLVEHQWLESLGDRVWPHSPDVTLPATEVGTFEVELKPGEALPLGAEEAAGLYAVNLARSFCKLPCDLPDKATSVTSNGTTIALASIAQFSDGLPGIKAVNDWVININGGTSKPKPPPIFIAPASIPTRSVRRL